MRDSYPASLIRFKYLPTILGEASPSLHFCLRTSVPLRRPELLQVMGRLPDALTAEAVETPAEQQDVNLPGFGGLEHCVEARSLRSPSYIARDVPYGLSFQALGSSIWRTS